MPSADYYRDYSGLGNQTTVPSHIDVVQGSTITAHFPLTKRLGWIFNNWNTEPDGSGITVVPFDTIQIDGSFSTLYGQWQTEANSMYRAIVHTEDGIVDFEQVGNHDIQINWGDGCRFAN